MQFFPASLVIRYKADGKSLQLLMLQNTICLKLREILLQQGASRGDTFTIHPGFLQKTCYLDLACWRCDSALWLLNNHEIGAASACVHSQVGGVKHCASSISISIYLNYR